MKRIAIPELVQLLILIGFFLLLATLIINRDLALFINPRFHWLTELTGFILLAMIAVQATQVFTKSGAISSDHHGHHTGCGCNHRPHLLTYLPFILTLLIAFILPNGSLDAKLAGNKGLGRQITADAAVSTNTASQPIAPELKKASMIEITERNYSEALEEITAHPAVYVGKNIDMTGFVYKDQTFPASQMILARYLVVCCVADAMPYGFLCEWETAEKYTTDSWLHIQGVLDVTTRNQKKIPVINVLSATPVDRPIHPYVYPVK